MKRPFAVIGFSMLSSAIVLYKLSFKAAVIALVAVTAAFCVLSAFKKLRKDKTVLCALLSAAIFTASFLIADCKLEKNMYLINSSPEITAVVCDTPSYSDYAVTYTLKVYTVNGKRTHFKLRYISQDSKGFRQGDRLSGKITFGPAGEERESFENSISNKILFSSYDEETDSLRATGEKSLFYYYLNSVKEYFTETLRLSIPGENGRIAEAMVTGEKDGLSRYTEKCFNYSGTAHLLVVSGLHLTMWSLGLMRVMSKSKRLRKYMIPAGFFGLFFYMALTGFTVSVLRAGAMIGGVLLGKLYRREADSINSIGIALTFILLINPFAAYSLQLWLSVLSTLGILLYSEKTLLFISNLSPVKPIMKFFAVRKIAEALSVSVPITAFTLPVYIVKIKVLPLFAFAANFLMVGAALFTMIFTVLGMILRLVGLHFISDGVYFAVGALTAYLRKTAEFIGFSEASTLGVSHRYFTYFLAVLLITAAAAYLLKQYGKSIFKPAAAVLTAVFVALSFYCTQYTANAPSLQVLASGKSQLIFMSFDGKTMLINGGDNPKCYYIEDILNSCNKKTIDALVMTEINSTTLPWYAAVKNDFPIGETLLCGENRELFENVTAENVVSVSAGGKFKADLSHPAEYALISCNDRRALILFGKPYENIFENGERYDIIIVNTGNCGENDTDLSLYSDNVIKLSDGGTVSVRF